MPLNAARAGVLLTVIASPWLQGSTPNWAIAILTQILLGLSALYVLGLTVKYQRPQLGWAMFPALLLYLIGWLSAWYPRSAFDPSLHLLIPVDLEGSACFGSIDGKTSLQAMMRFSAILAAFCMCWDAASNAKYRQGVIVSIVISGVLLAAYGLIQKTGGDVLGIWEGRRLSINVFSTFWYHANAGAFLNMIWPLVLMLTVRNFKRNGNQVLRAFLVLASITLILSEILNASKAAQIIFVLETFVSVIVIKNYLKLAGQTFHFGFWVPFLVIGIVLVVLVQFLGSGASLQRWNHLLEQDYNDSRWSVYWIYLKMASEAGWTGFGPGTFSIAFDLTPYREQIPGFWKFAHNDYLQTLLEWGWSGLLLWVIWAFMIVKACHSLMKQSSSHGSGEVLTRSMLLISIFGVAIHAAVDFPLQIYAIQLHLIVLITLAMQHECILNGRTRKKYIHGTARAESTPPY